MFALILCLFNLLSLVAITCVSSYAVISYTHELNAYHYEAFNLGTAMGYSMLGVSVFYGLLVACYQLGRIIVDNIREAIADIRYAREDRKLSVRATYGKATCTCDGATCKGAHWQHWTCPSPDMDVETWERMKLAHVRPVSARRARRAPRVHAIARISIIAVSGVPVA